MNIVLVGASSGIGKELAFIYAKNRPQCNLFLVARRENLLKEVRDQILEIMAQYSFDGMMVTFNFHL